MSNISIAIIVSGLFIAIGINYASPRYEILPIATSNPAVWKLDKFSGDVYLCATANGKDTESGCSKKLKQF